MAVALAPLIALILAATVDAPGLVARLGSGPAAGREEAARDLEAMGRVALPALVEACRSPDPEVRSRALAVWERIQRGLMVRPTMVRGDGGLGTIAEVVRSIGEQAGFDLGGSQRGEQPPAKVLGAAPLPFWEAIERIGLSGGHFDITNPDGGHFPTLAFWGEGDASPTSTSGPIRVKLKGLHDHRDLALIAGPWLRVDSINQRIPVPRGAPDRQARFFAELDLMVEPRMWFSMEGPARVTEAVDDLGQSLVPRDGASSRADHTVFRTGGGVTQGQAEVDLAMPGRPGRSIARLRGTIPVVLQVRRPVPDLEIPLPGGLGKTFALPEGVFTVRDSDSDESWARVAVDVRLDLGRLEIPDRRDVEVARSRMRCLESHQVEVVDALGNVLDEHAGGGWRVDGSTRLNFTISRTTYKARPARFRYYGMVRAFVDVAFEFRNIPMP